MNSMRLRWAVLGVAILFSAACETDSDTTLCDGGSSDVVCSLNATPVSVSSNDAGTTYQVTIEAQIPRLIGGAQAVVSASDGTVGSAMPGTDSTVFLSPIPGAAAGSLSGKVKWILPPHDTAQIIVRMEEATFSKIITSP